MNLKKEAERIQKAVSINLGVEREKVASKKKKVDSKTAKHKVSVVAVHV